jgi:mono/diheme cytochrome c family protein
MRVLAVGLLLLAACDRNPNEEQQTSPAEPAQLSYEGADYKDQAAKIAHGKRLATILECISCHGENMQGSNVTADNPQYGDMNAPNLTLLLAQYSDGDFDKLIRQGMPKDGRELWFMPVESYQFLSDADVTAIIAYLRTFKPAGKQLPPMRRGPEYEQEIARGLVGNARSQIAKYRHSPPIDLGKQHEWGRYIVQTTCTGCHNNALQGWEDFTPSLDLAGAYSHAELEHLLVTGEGKVKKNLGMMTETAKESLSQLTPRERAAVIAYVKARAERPQ